MVALWGVLCCLLVYGGRMNKLRQWWAYFQYKRAMRKLDKRWRKTEREIGKALVPVLKEILRKFEA